MPTTKQREDQSATPPSDMHDKLRERARANFAASVERMVEEQRFGDRFAGLSELEIMEAATEMTLRK